MAASQALGAAPAAMPPSDRGHPTVLVADPDPDACQALVDLCTATAATLITCSDGAESLFLIGRSNPDLTVLSARLPVITAPEVIAAVRRHSAMPIAVGIGLGEADHAAPAVAAGATDILGRPYRRAELQLLLNPFLVRARLRRDLQAVITLGQLELDSLAYEVRAWDRPVKLTLREFELLRFLMRHADRVVTQEEIRRDVWRARGEDASANTIAVHIRRIRARIGSAALLINVRGVGYRLTPAPDPAGYPPAGP
ncbi:MtrAB system response regulator MtrA [soil metagenome]